MLRIGSLFSGAAGLDRAVAEVFDGEVAWFSEVDPAASKVLAHHFPTVPNLGSVTEIDWATVPPVDVICGGFPCTDVSAAGKRAGMHGTRSGLWSHMAEAIDVLRPRYVLIENVRGLLNANANRPMESTEDDLGDGSGGPVLRAIGAVLGDLADIGGYEARWVTLAAAAVGAPHRRERVFILAHANTSGVQPERWGDAGDVVGTPRGRAGVVPVASTPRRLSTVAVPLTDLPDLLPTPTARDHKGTDGPGDHRRHSPGIDAVTHHFPALLPTPGAADGQRGQDYARVNRDGSGGDDLVTAAVKAHNESQWGKYAPAIARWEAVLGRPAPAPTEPNRNGKPRLNPEFSSWMMGWPAGWVTDPAIGISRNDQLRIVGNGVVSHCAAAALWYLLAIEAAA